MDIKQEITNHLEWIEKIASLLGSEDLSDEELQVITQHDRCSLGQWLESEASSTFKELPEFEELIASHEAFHKLAGKLITALEQGNEDEALASGKQFIEMSQQVVSHLQLLQEKSRTDPD